MFTLTPSCWAASRTGRWRHLGELGRGEPHGSASEARPLPAGARQAGSGPLDQAGAFELAQGAQDVELQPTGGRRQVQPFLEAHERDAALVELLDGRHDVRQAAAEAVERLQTQITSMRPRRASAMRRVERRPAVLDAGDALVDELAGDVHCGWRVGSQVVQLVFGVFVGGRNYAAVQSRHA